MMDPAGIRAKLGLPDGELRRKDIVPMRGVTLMQIRACCGIRFKLRPHHGTDVTSIRLLFLILTRKIAKVLLRYGD